MPARDDRPPLKSTRPGRAGLACLLAALSVATMPGASAQQPPRSPASGVAQAGDRPPAPGNAPSRPVNASSARAVPAAGAAGPAVAPLSASADGVSLNFREAEIDAVVQSFAEFLGRNVVIDPRVRGRMTLETARPVSRTQAFDLLRVSLRGHGFAIVDSQGLLRVLPEAEAKLQAVPMAGADAGLGAASGEQLVTRVFQLRHESANAIVPVLRPLIPSNNTVTAFPGGNSLVVTDYASNMARIASIIESLDRPTEDEVQVVPIANAVAADIAVAVARMLEEAPRYGGTTGPTPAQQQTGEPGQRVTVLADPRLNAVLLRSSNPERLRLARGLVARLDQPSADPGNIHVVYLRNAEAVKLAQTLRGVLTGEAGQPGGATTSLSSSLAAAQTPGSSGSPLAGNAGTMTGTASSATQRSATAAGAPQSLSTRVGAVSITADPSTNALIITAPDPVYRSLRSVIDRLDMRRAQVFIESLIVEVQADKAAELGIQWQFLGAPQGSTRAIGGTNFNPSGGGANILGATANIGSVGNGLNIGVVRGTVTLPGAGEVLNLGMLARALESDASGNILATPNLLTLDNEEARIIIGQNVPFITGQFANATGTGTINPFQTIERRDVGTTLRVRPQVSDSGTVRLQIFQEVSSVQSTTLAAGIVTNRRAIESTVLVDDGEIIVLGGLIEERVEDGEQKVPLLGDLPFLGGLFRYEGRKRSKTNLLVFLRPIVLRDAEASNSVTATRYDYIRALRGEARVPASGPLPELISPPLPAMPAPVAPGTTLPPAISRPPASLAPDVDAASRSRRGATPPPASTYGN
jgi:general secretion pathway protein D